jgi:hypothetical protein
MNKNKVIVILILAVVIAAVVWYVRTQRPGVTGEKKAVDYTLAAPAAPAASATPAAPTVCDASAAWVSNPLNPPTEIPLGANAQICQFHQFSWQWFISLMNVVGDNRVFQDEANYPLLQAQGVNSCTTTGTKTRLFVRTQKDDDNPNDDFTLPERIGQALGDVAIYDQNGNVVFYEVRFSRDQCSLDQNTATMFPPGTTEIKVSYRVITEADKPNYVWINADINGDGNVGTDELLGMVGFHLVKSTALHPEFIWATFEHKLNAPDCQATPAPNPPAWSFTSATCAGQLPNSIDPTTCNFNMAAKGAGISGGPPTQICRVYHDGSKPGDDKFDTNVANIDSLNTQLVGVNGFITALPDSNPLAVLKNYMLVGALWENDITQPSSNLANQRGSIQLANTTMETTAQMATPAFSPIPYTGTGNLQTAKNCFACHNYTPNNNVTLSHTFPLIQGSGAQKLTGR